MGQGKGKGERDEEGDTYRDSEWASEEARRRKKGKKGRTTTGTTTKGKENQSRGEKRITHRREEEWEQGSKAKEQAKRKKPPNQTPGRVFFSVPFCFFSCLFFVSSLLGLSVSRASPKKPSRPVFFLCLFVAPRPWPLPFPSVSLSLSSCFFVFISSCFFPSHLLHPPPAPKKFDDEKGKRTKRP